VGGFKWAAVSLKHGAAHGDVPSGGGNVQGGHVGSAHEGHPVVLAGWGAQASLALVRQAGPVSEQHLGGLQVAVGCGDVQRCVPPMRIHVNEPVGTFDTVKGRGVTLGVQVVWEVHFI
jgi:hypothetical protein